MFVPGSPRHLYREDVLYFFFLLKTLNVESLDVVFFFLPVRLFRLFLRALFFFLVFAHDVKVNEVESIPRAATVSCNW